MFFGTLGVAAFAIFAYLTFAFKFIATCPSLQPPDEVYDCVCVVAVL